VLAAGDVVDTKDSIASINAEGSMVLLKPESSVQFKGNLVAMNQGGVVVTTSKALSVTAGFNPGGLDPFKI